MTEKIEPKKEIVSLDPKMADTREIRDYKISQFLAKSNIIPKDFQGKPENVFIAIQMGREVGLKPMQAIQNIMVVNGRPSLWGDAVWALVKNHPDLEYAHEADFEEIEKTGTAWCEIKMKRADKAVRRTFSEDDAKKAGLLGKPGPWQQYKNRMKQMRARGFAARDAAPDALKGLSIVEEMMDVVVPQEIEMLSMPKAVEPTPKEPAAAPAAAPVETTTPPAAIPKPKPIEY